MKWLKSSAILALLASSGLAWGSGPSLKNIMKAWKADAHFTTQMLNGDIPYEEAAARKALEAFVADSQTIDARLSGATARSKDVKLRFEKFGADSATALNLLGSRDKFKISYARVLNECKSCHDQYAN